MLTQIKYLLSLKYINFVTSEPFKLSHKIYHIPLPLFGTNASTSSILVCAEES